VATKISTYYFNASNIPLESPYYDWINPENVFDGSDETYGYETYFYESHHIQAGGTNSPTSGGAISGVRARILCSSNLDAPAWNEYEDLTAPAGGWTWTVISHMFAVCYPSRPYIVPILRTALFNEDRDGEQLNFMCDSQTFTEGFTEMRLHKVEIEVTYEEQVIEFPYSQIYPVIGITARGKIGHLFIFKQYKERFWNNHIEYPQNPDRYKLAGNQGRVVTKYYYPYNPRTASQQANRGKFADGMYNWKYFDENTKIYYDELRFPIRSYGLLRYLQLYLASNPTMIIYWDDIQKSATDTIRIPDYISSQYFGASCYPASILRLLGLGPSGDLTLPKKMSVGGYVGLGKDNPYNSLDVAGAIRFSHRIIDNSSPTSFFGSYPHTIVLSTPTGNYASAIGIDISNSISTTSRGITIYDRRTSDHQASLQVLRADGNDAFGMMFNGASTQAIYQTLTSAQNFVIGRNFSSNSVLFLKVGGNVGIGTVTPNYKLEVVSDSAGKPGASGLWTVVSDKRIKKDIVLADLDRCYEIVKKLPLKYFGWDDGVYNEENVKDRHSLGWVAQDVQKVFPKSTNPIPFTKKIDTGEVEEYEEITGVVKKTKTGKPKMVHGELEFETVKKTRPIIKEEKIDDCLDMNSGQIIAALYGAVQKLQTKVENLENGVK